MNKKNTEKLLKDYPDLYKHISEFECCDGWFLLLKVYSARLNEKIAKQKQQQQIFAIQVKEKFGFLRIYMNRENEAISKIIEECRKESESICEICGDDGNYNKDGHWMEVRCNEHRKRRGGTNEPV